MTTSAFKNVTFAQIFYKMNEYLARLQQNIAPLRNQIVNHKVYGVIETIDELKIFMQYHVFAVWDFMSLLKSLQNNLTCTQVPWFPVGDANTRYLINEIVLGEESDVDKDGNRTSHFELYLQAMEKCGANTAQIKDFIKLLQQNNNLNEALINENVAPAAQEFVQNTFQVIQTNQAHLQSAVFTFGREDLIPDMFYAIVNDIQNDFAADISYFKYYLERHIEVDGDHHSHLALEMTANLCDDEEKWLAAELAVISSLKSRIALWDGVFEEIIRNKSAVLTH